MVLKNRNEPVPELGNEVGNGEKVVCKDAKDKGNDRHHRVQYCKLVIKSLLFFLVGFFGGAIFRFLLRLLFGGLFNNN